MSHIVTIQTKVRDPAAVAAACRRMSLPAPAAGTAMLFGGEVSGLLVQLPGWTYPAVVDLASGEVKFDNFGGHWGDRAHLDRFLQLYAVELVKLQARAQGYPVTEQALEDGGIKLQVIEGA
ncbi:MAG TPA: hypothetical protein VH120_17775 [Gemmataceae bacterium]|jgi:hypothetical protein|nr:hypothetical protein [Gemmataceae bacterium]